MARATGPPATTRKPSIPHLASTGDPPSDDPDSTNSGCDSDGYCSDGTVSSEADSSDGEGRPRRPTNAKKTKPTLRADQLSEEQVRTVETEFCLEPLPDGSLGQRQERASATVRGVRKQLRNERNGHLADGAVSRVAIQRACELLSKIEVAGQQGASWTRQWRGQMGVAIDEKFGSMTSGIGWLYGVLASKTRLAAMGGSQIAVERSTRYGKTLRGDQQLDEALAALKKADPQFDGWCAPPLPSPCPPRTRARPSLDGRLPLSPMLPW